MLLKKQIKLGLKIDFAIDMIEIVDRNEKMLEWLEVKWLILKLFGGVFFFFFNQRRASLMAQQVKNLPAVWETWVLSWIGKIP